MKNIRELINANPSNKTLAQLFEYLCLIHGHVFSIILPLQQLNEQSNESERLLYLHNLNNVYGIFESTKALLHRNHNRFRHTQLFSVIQMAFLEFHSQVQVQSSQALGFVWSRCSIDCRCYVIDGQRLRQRVSIWTRAYQRQIVEQQIQKNHRSHRLENQTRNRTQTA